MNEQSQMMKQPSQMMKQPSQMMKQQPSHQVISQPLPQVMNSVQSHIMNQTQLIGQSQPMKLPVMGQINQSLPLNLGPSQGMLNKPLMFDSRSYNPNMKKYHNPSSSSKSNFTKSNRSNWKGKKNTNDKRPIKDSMRRIDNFMPDPINAAGHGGTGGYKPPSLNELQSQNSLRARKFLYPKKNFKNRFAPYAPRNTSSFIIRAKKAGGIASLVSPCPVTPAVLPTPMFSPSREVLGDTAKEEWGVDGYGSMKGLIRLRGHDLEPHDDDEEEEGGSSESDVEEHVEMERRLDHDLSRFEMIYPNYGGVEYNNGLENRVDDQDTHIAQLEEENLTLKERLFLMERELGDLRRRMLFLERKNQIVEDVNEEVMENGSENDSEGGESDIHVGGENNVEMLANIAANGCRQNSVDDMKEENNAITRDVWMDEVVAVEVKVKEVDYKSNHENTGEQILHNQVNLKEGKMEEAQLRENGGTEMSDNEKDNEKLEEASSCKLGGDEMCFEKHSDESEL